MSPLFQTVLSNVGGSDTGAASGALQALQQVGGALGVAIMGELFFAGLASAGAEGTPSQAVYAAALARAVLWNVAAFVAIGAAVLLLRGPRESGRSTRTEIATG